MKKIVVGMAFAMALARTGKAHDPWEAGFFHDDTIAVARTALGIGSVQQHDLDESGGENDVDHVRVPTLKYHSYEARLSGTALVLDTGFCANCGQFERVDAGGTILTDDVATVNEAPGLAVEPMDRSIRWLATSDTISEWLRVTGNVGYFEDSSSVYTLRYWDTTYTVPRWNASGSQTTVFVITSLVQAAVEGNIHFFSGSGALLHSQPLVLVQNAPFVFNAATVPVLSGQSGFALVAHTAGYGGLTGKAVSLEPSTGFTFDTAMAPIPQ